MFRNMLDVTTAVPASLSEVQPSFVARLDESTRAVER
jgi:hypothetical protein